MIPTSIASLPGLSQLAGTSVQPPVSRKEPVEQPQVTGAIQDQVVDTVDSEQQQQNQDLTNINEAVKQLQKTANLANRELRFRVDESTGVLQVLVLDSKTDEVIREIPPDELLRLAQRIKETLSLVIDTVA